MTESDDQVNSITRLVVYGFTRIPGGFLAGPPSPAVLPHRVPGGNPSRTDITEIDQAAFYPSCCPALA